jgi:hypothetical protein
LQMNKELFKSAIATVFRRKGKTLLSEDEFVYAVSMELRWFNPSAARRLLENAKRYGLVTIRQGGITPSFSLEDRDLKPVVSPPSELAEEETDIVSTVVSELSSKLNVPRNELLAQINRLKREKNIETLAAAVEIALKNGMEVSHLAGLALQELARQYGKKFT